MKKQMPSWVFATAIALTVFVAIWVAGKSMPPDPSSPALTATALPIADITGKTATGETFRLSDHRGKVVLLNFWATWCGPCRMEIPDLIKLQKKYSDRGFTVVGLSQDEDLELAASFAKAEGLNYPVLLAEQEVSRAFRVSAIPTSFLINKEGKIIWATVGLVSGDDIAKEIEKAL